MAMNITIDQSSIEAAIETHVRELIPGLAEDTVISITLSATRGPSGFTASIDLLPAGSVKTPAATPAPAPVETKPAKAPKALNIPKANETKAETKQEEAPAVTEDKPEDTAPVAQAEEQAEVSPATNEAASAEDTAEVQSGDLTAQEEAEQPAEPAEAAPRASLFSGLNKPKN